MRPFQELHAVSPSPRVLAPIRTTPIYDLRSGKTLALLAAHRQPFGEQVRFGPAALTGLPDNPAKWLAGQLSALGPVVDAPEEAARPILVPAPLTALAHSNTAIACDAALRATALCHQEICLEFADAAFAGETLDAIGRLASLRRKGFRVGLDMRRAWNTPLDDSLRLMVDMIRVDARMLDASPDLLDICETAGAAGIMVVAENVHWRDGDGLSRLGIYGGIAPRTDA